MNLLHVMNIITLDKETVNCVDKCRQIYLYKHEDKPGQNFYSEHIIDLQVYCVCVYYAYSLSDTFSVAVFICTNGCLIKKTYVISCLACK